MDVIPPGSTIGILGGGQLGRMIAQAAEDMGYKVIIFCPSAESPALQVSGAKHVIADYGDEDALREFAKHIDIATFEFENVPDTTIQLLEKEVPVRPGWKALHVAQDRIQEKGFFREIGVPTTNYVRVKDLKSLQQGFQELGGKKAILKTARLGYDGKGQFIIEDAEQLEEAWDTLGGTECILEEFVLFDKEVSVIVARNVNTSCAVFPCTENIHRRGILDTSLVPAVVDPEVSAKAEEYALKIALNLHIIGLVAVEFFVKMDGKRVLVNEIAPRPHNSGHWTMDGCVTSQFEQLVRAICGLPLGNVALHSEVRMKNLLGREVEEWEDILKDPNAKLHLYGKLEAHRGRKMGHVNYVKPLAKSDGSSTGSSKDANW